MKPRLHDAVQAMRLTSKKWGLRNARRARGDESYTMMPGWQPERSHGGDLSGHDEYAMWDAADRRRDHCRPSNGGNLKRTWPTARCAAAPLASLSACRPCCRSWIGTSWRPSTIGRRVEPPLPAELSPSLLAKVSWRRRRSRIATWTAGSPQPRCWRSVCLSALRVLTRHPCPPRHRRAFRFSRWRRSGRTSWPRRSHSAASSGERSSR